jgi:hypothetical protein
MEDEKCIVCGKILGDGDIIVTEESDERGRNRVFVVDTDLCRDCLANQLAGALAAPETASA